MPYAPPMPRAIAVSLPSGRQADRSASEQRLTASSAHRWSWSPQLGSRWMFRWLRWRLPAWRSPRRDLIVGRTRPRAQLSQLRQTIIASRCSLLLAGILRAAATVGKTLGLVDPGDRRHLRNGA